MTICKPCSIALRYVNIPEPEKVEVSMPNFKSTEQKLIESLETTIKVQCELIELLKVEIQSLKSFKEVPIITPPYPNPFFRLDKTDNPIFPYTVTYTDGTVSTFTTYTDIPLNPIKD